MTEEQIEENKKKFIEIYNQNVVREGKEALLEYLLKSDFFVAPASTKFHSATEGGLCQHSLKVYERLKALVESEKCVDASPETVAICGLLHDVCKIGYYKIEMRNRKVDGVWVQQPFFTVEDSLPYGHGEKSVYILGGFLRLTREEAMAINWHMGWSDVRAAAGNTIGLAYNKYPLAALMHVADVLATYLDENSDLN